MEDKIDADELFDSIEGISVDVYRQQRAFKNDIRNKAEKVKNTPVEDWPEIKINWDLSKEAQRFCCDGMKQEEFDEYYPNGFFIYWVCLDDFDSVLGDYSRRDEGELWAVGSESKLAEMIIYLSEGHPISPPISSYVTETNKIILSGGHHRYAVAKAIGEKNIPICMDMDNKIEIEKLIKIYENPEDI